MTGKQLTETRKQMGWTQYFLADALGVTRSSLAHWESDRAPLPSDIEKAVRGAQRLVERALLRLGRD